MVNGGPSVGAGDIRRVCDALPTATIPVWRWENQRLSVRYVAADGNVQHDVSHMPETSDREFLDVVRSVHDEVAGNPELAGMLRGIRAFLASTAAEMRDDRTARLFHDAVNLLHGTLAVQIRLGGAPT